MTSDWLNTNIKTNRKIKTEAKLRELINIMSVVSDKVQVVKVTIFGEVYQIRGSDDPEFTSHVADYVDKKMNEIVAKTRNISPHKIAVLAALNLAGELLELKKDSTDNLSDVENRTINIIRMLDDTLPDNITD